MRAALQALAALLAGLSSVLPARAQSELSELVRSYHAAVTDYASGDRARAVIKHARWPSGNTAMVLDGARWDPMTTRAAAMLETDVAFSPGVDLETMTRRLDHASRWLIVADQHRAAGADKGFRRRWYLTVARRLIFRGLVGVADRMLGDAARIFPGDLDVTFARGLAKESLAGSYVVDPAAPQNMMTLMRRQRADALAAARSAFETIVKSLPSATEAHLRLAHVYIAQKLEDRAVPLLDSVRASSPPAMAYLASLMLGDIHMRRGQFQPAMRLFGDARRLAPGAQNAYLAQAYALRATGKLDEAASVLEEMLARPAREADPWKQYPLGFDVTAADLEPLRSEVSRR